MAFDPDLPANETKLVAAPGVIQNNWAAIEQGDDSFLPYSINLYNRTDDGSLNDDPDYLATAYKLYCKEDSSGNPELFGRNILDPGGTPTNNEVQLTRGAPTKNSSGSTYIPGGILMAWGRSTSISNNGTITVSAMTTIYQATFTIEDSSSSPASRAYISGISTNVITVKVPTGGSVVLRWIAIGV
jgi:hypothetical protein